MSKISCTDINECGSSELTETDISELTRAEISELTVTDICGNGICNNTEGSFICHCDEGFTNAADGLCYGMCILIVSL